MLALTFTCRVLLIFLLPNSVKMTEKNQLQVLDEQWPQTCVLDCARGRHTAVCGSDGRMYKSLCSFQRARCVNSQLRMDTLSACTGDALNSKCQLARSKAVADSFGVFIPACNADGTFAEVQCHNRTGYCWCSTADGMPVSGSSVLHRRPNCTGLSVPPFWGTIQLNSVPDGNRPVGRPTDFLNECERERMSWLAKAGDGGSEEHFIPECSADGQYKSIQCHSTGYCWCVRVDSGRPIPGTTNRNQLPDCSFQETHTPTIKRRCRVTRFSDCPGVQKTDFLNSLIQAFQQEVESVAPSSSSRTPSTPPPPVHSLRLYFMRLDADGNGDLDEREARPLRLLLHRNLHSRRCAKKFMQSCDSNANSRLSAQELTSCLGI